MLRNQRGYAPIKILLWLTTILFLSSCLNQTDVNIALKKNAINTNAPAGNSGDQTNNEITALGVKYFSFYDLSTGHELWTSDGTTNGTRMIKDIFPGTSSGSPHSFISYNGKVFFAATDPVYGNELWVTDGTEAGTTLVRDINPAGDAYINSLFVINNKILFTAYDGVNGEQLWITDGTTAGTSNVIIIPQNIYPIQGFYKFGNKVVFTADDGIHGGELWITDGTAAGTFMLVDAVPGNNDWYGIRNIEVVGNQLIFRPIKAGYTSSDLWITDGTISGTHFVTNFTAGKGQLLKVINIGSTIYFFEAPGSATTPNLYRVNPTTFALTQVTSLTNGNDVYGIYEINGNIIFEYNDNSTYGAELYVWNQTNGFSILKDFATGIADSQLSSLVKFDNHYYFQSVESDGHYLYKTDGTPSGTVRVSTLSLSTGANYTGDMSVVDDKLILTLYDNNLSQLWTSDGSSAGTRKVVDLHQLEDEAFHSIETIEDSIYIYTDNPGNNSHTIWHVNRVTGEVTKLLIGNGTLTAV